MSISRPGGHRLVFLWTLSFTGVLEQTGATGIQPPDPGNEGSAPDVVAKRRTHRSDAEAAEGQRDFWRRGTGGCGGWLCILAV